MKYLILLTAGFIMIIQGGQAQSPDEARLAVHYKFSHVQDTNNRDNPYRENMVLLVGKRCSLYKSFDRRVEQKSTTNPDGTVRTDTRGFGSLEEYYQFPVENELVMKDNIHSVPPPMTDLISFIIPGPLPEINWHITGDTTSFGGLHCQKATTHFKGRDYTAWFCPELPIHVGPWKLNGLPGIILDAHDNRREVQFIFDGINKVDSTVIQIPEKGIRTTDKEFARLEETVRKDPQAYLKLVMAQGVDYNGPRPSIRFDSKPMPGFAFNNPIELPETK
ncbi:MAG TPA: GLPGLI family protein [Puia sp.]|nr:GLPGLI family protein [Puia sp.]